MSTGTTSSTDTTCHVPHSHPLRQGTKPATTTRTGNHQTPMTVHPQLRHKQTPPLRQLLLPVRVGENPPHPPRGRKQQPPADPPQRGNHYNTQSTEIRQIPHTHRIQRRHTRGEQAYHTALQHQPPSEQSTQIQRGDMVPARYSRHQRGGAKNQAPWSSLEHTVHDHDSQHLHTATAKAHHNGGQPRDGNGPDNAARERTSSGEYHRPDRGEPKPSPHTRPPHRDSDGTTSGDNSPAPVRGRTHPSPRPGDNPQPTHTKPPTS